MWSGTLSFARPSALPVFAGSQTNEDVWEGSEESGSEDTSWISWFCSLPGHDYFCEVEEEFIEDDFNLTGLSTMVSYYQEALEMILDIEPEDESITEADAQAIESSAAVLYGLIHQRFILTRQGMQLMMHKYDQVQFGECPRVYCMQTPMLPCSLSDVPCVDTVLLYCPSCRDLYHPPATRHQHLDGAYFGTTFAHMFFSVYTGFTWPGKAHPQVYTPKVFGFVVNELSAAGQHMGWLRTWQGVYESDVEDITTEEEGDNQEGQPMEEETILVTTTTTVTGLPPPSSLPPSSLPEASSSKSLSNVKDVGDGDEEDTTANELSTKANINNDGMIATTTLTNTVNASSSSPLPIDPLVTEMQMVDQQD